MPNGRVFLTMLKPISGDNITPGKLRSFRALCAGEPLSVQIDRSATATALHRLRQAREVRVVPASRTAERRIRRRRFRGTAAMRAQHDTAYALWQSARAECNRDQAGAE